MNVPVGLHMFTTRVQSSSVYVISTKLHFCNCLCIISVDDSTEEGESAAEYREGGLNEGGLNWRGAFKGGIVSGVTHLLNCTASKTNLLLAFKILFNMIDLTEALARLYSRYLALV